MRMEKINSNKLKIILSINELEDEKIDYHSFMAGSEKSKNIISNLLYIAKDELGFDIQDCNIEIEKFEITQGNFILTITKFQKSEKKPKVKRKQFDIQNDYCIYEFSNLSNYYDFIIFFKNYFKKIYKSFIKNSEIYCSTNKYILIVNCSELSPIDSKIFNTVILEFANFKSTSKTLISKIREFYEKKQDINI